MITIPTSDFTGILADVIPFATNDDELPDTSAVRLEWSGYVATVHPSPDVSIPLDRGQAVAYAMGVLQVVAEAEYDAAIARQIRAMGRLPAGERDQTGQAAAAATIQQLRERRPKERTDQTALEGSPLAFSGGVSALTGDAFVHVHLYGQPLTQWTPADARGHAQYVLEAAIVAELDQGYLEFLTTVLALDRETARKVVDNLGHHRGEG